MNQRAPQTTIDSPTSSLAVKAAFVLALLVCGVAISHQSYWIDETDTGYISSLPTLHDMWQWLRSNGNATLQVPFYQFSSWAWEKCVGFGEFAMRAQNVLWFVPGVMLMTQALAATRRLQWSVLLVLLLSPFVWFYLNEARPYAMQIGASLMVFASLLRLGSTQNKSAHERWWVVALCLAALLLAGSGMLAMLWLGAYLGAAALSSPRQHLWSLAKSHWPCWAVTALLLLVTGLYYLWTVSIGARASRVGSTGFKSTLYIFYEFLGFSGLGPARADLRTGTDVLWHSAPWLGAYAAIVLIVLAIGWRTITSSTSRRIQLVWLLAFTLVLGFLLTVGVTVHFRVLARHCAPLFPLILLIVGSGISSLAGRSGRAARLTAVVFLGFNLASCLLLRFSPVHAKEDYRGAAAIANGALARGDTVWWSACRTAAWVYHVPITLSDDAKPGKVISIENEKEGFQQHLPKPDLVLTSKPDLYDANGALARYLSEMGFRPIGQTTAITFWRASGK
jgi:hypothetical protein